MVFVPMVHTRQPVTETRHSRELGLRFDEVVREYKRLNPELTDAEVYTALTASMQRSGGRDEGRQRRMAFAIIAALVAVFTGVAMNGGKFSGPGDDWLLAIIGVAAVVGAIAFAVIRLARRG